MKNKFFFFTSNGSDSVLNNQFSALFNSGSSRFDADNINTANGLVTGFVDYVDPTHVLAQATVANQVSASVADPRFNNAKTVQFVSGASTHYVSNRGAGQWKHLHDGTGCTIIAVYALTDMQSQTLFGTYTSGMIAGFAQSIPSTATTFRVAILNDTGLLTVDCDNLLVNQLNTATYQTFTYKENNVPEMLSYNRGVLADSGDSGNAPGTNTPPVPLNLGRRANGTSYAQMKFAAFYCWNRVLSSAEFGVVQRFIQHKYGIGPS